MGRKSGMALLAAAALIVIGSVALKFAAPRPGQPPVASEEPPAGTGESSTPGFAPLRSHSSSNAPLPASRPRSATAQRPGFLQNISGLAGRFTPEQVARYLERNGTNAQTLLAAADLGTNRLEYLALAAQLFPDDPRVQLAVVTEKMFPDQRREWLDRLKKSDPKNPVALFLSASDHFRAGDAASAIAELSAAGSMGGYTDYSSERMEAMEQAYVQEGRTPAEAKALAIQSMQLPQLAQYKEVLNDIDALQKQYRATGDVESANAMAQIGLGLGVHLTEGEGAGLLISQLVGVAIERRMLTQLPPDAAPAFIGMTVQERLDELDKFRRNARDWAQEATALMQRGDEAEISAYYEYMRKHGESEALKWLQERRR